MAYKTGTARNERDLLDILNTFLTTDSELVANGQAWTVLLDRTLPATATQKEIRQIAWKSTGTGIEQDIYICASSANLIAADTYNLNFWGGTFFNPSFVTPTAIHGGLINPSPGVALFADSRPIEYHIVADGRCCKIVTRISQVCSSAYLGFILPTVPPTEYPYPLCIAGSAPLVSDTNSAVFIRYSQSNEYHSSIVNPSYGNCWLMTPDQTWRDFYGQNYKNITTDSSSQFLYPMGNFYLYSGYMQPQIMTKMGASAGGSYPLLQVEFFSTGKSSQGGNRWGAMDGVYWIPGLQRAAGDNVTIADGRRGVVFNGGFRVGTKDYFVIETGA
ncbi:hypothetical protein RZ65_00525 [[Haemophilus] ducreyi]|uniref:hypothetical protein n=1 Tax=Haemophilus ducreyi TaxID=730 RepID=UPI0006558724|nr:hypothetical protein [[Haemophilus] ducreyi]AKO36073.1 hypothetical protein RZ61_00535 [[Haemophilus] ducreyi]AKO37529.1 hypothetical protein RZ62_00530 [[Haemophilus] ducreyi]AKO40575.1 hypothetical protein RZ64_00530 [[Haemophilus] ducreyi]AKO42026.1 hypothetical protein RZ65_00525 [[Haemophilus] ducreyi]ANF69913.1 hypothetical protein A6043_00370 [[Haemophilus] ducreyi]